MRFHVLLDSRSQNNNSQQNVTFVCALNNARVLALNAAHVLRLNKADVLALNKAHALRLNTKTCPVFTVNTKGATRGGRPKAASPLWRRPKAASFVLAVNTGHILVLRRNACALLRAKTSAFLSRKTRAVLRARTCALFRANTKEITEGGGLRRPPLWWRPKAATFVLPLNKAHVLALNTAHVLRLNNADVLALNKAHVLRLNTKICPAFVAT